MPDYLIRVEAVNFDNFIDDTNDLSTIRGGGLLLLKATGRIETENPNLKKIYAGASTGLFEATFDDESAAVAFCADLKTSLETGEWKEATFAVDWCAFDTNDFPRCHALVTARNRRSQLRAPSRILPKGEDEICELDRLRPATKTMPRKGASEIDNPEERDMFVSDSVKGRREHGIHQKRAFYDSHAPGNQHKQFTNDLNEIGDYRGAGKLNGKIALIYLDGNGFGKILRECQGKGAAASWSNLIRGNQDSFLQLLLAEPVGREDTNDWLWSGTRTDSHGRDITVKRALRLETLLWGGDEIIWVVPAWKGWWLMENFFARYGARGLSFNPDDKGARPLTHSAGLVFCHSDAPVKRIKKLAGELTEAPKDIMRSGEAVNYCAYQVLESFDHLGADPDKRRSALVEHLGMDNTALLLKGKAMVTAAAAVRKLKGGVPKSRLVEVAAILYRDRDMTGGLKAGDKLFRENKQCPKAEDFFQPLVDVSAVAFPNATREQRKAIAWLHLAELWDYIPGDEECQ